MEDFQKVTLLFPNKWQKLSKATESPLSFNWFICSSRRRNPDGFYIASISPESQFYDPDTGEMFNASGLIAGETPMQPELLIISDPYNKRKLKEMGMDFGCDSKKSVLSKECEMHVEENLYKAAKFASSIDLDGVAIRHQCLDSKIKSFPNFLCGSATFLFRRGILQPVGEERCGILCYSKRYNSCIRKVVPDFPTCSEIDILLSKFSDDVVRTLLLEDLQGYFSS